MHGYGSLRWGKEGGERGGLEEGGGRGRRGKGEEGQEEEGRGTQGRHAGYSRPQQMMQLAIGWHVQANMHVQGS